MKLTSTIKTTLGAAAAVALTATTAITASAALVIHEPFDYADTEPANDGASLGDGNQAGGLNLGQWRQVNTGTNEIEVTVPGLTFTDGGGHVLPSSGGYGRKVVRVGQAAVSSDVASAATSALTADNSTMWMSFIYQDQGFSGPTSALMLASEDMIASDNHSLVSAGFGVGIAIRDSGNQTRAINTAYYNGTTNYTRVPEANPTFLVSGGPENISFLLAAKVNWKPDGTPDEIFVFNITDLTTEPDEADAIASDTFDMLLVNQQSLDVLNIGETQADGWDEIRFATTFAEVVGGAAPSKSFNLTITPNASTPGHYDFSWSSQDGKIYDLVSALDLSTAPGTWPVWDGRTGLAATAPTNMLADIPGGGDSRRFFAVIEKNAPPPPPLLEEHFDAAGPGLPAGWVAVNATTIWDVGDPTGLPSLQDDDGTNCVGTNVAAGNYADEVATVTVTSPPVAIPAGGATLDFRQYIDSDAANGDVGAVRLLDATDSEIVEGSFPVTGIDGIQTGWSNKSYTLPPSAAGQSVKVVFELTTLADGSVYNGFYIDDVVITGN